MEASSSSAAAATGNAYFPIYISSDEEDVQAYHDDSYSPEDIEIQEAILLSIGRTRAASTTPSSASPSSPRPYGAVDTEETPLDLKGKRKVSSEGGLRESKKQNRSERNLFNCAICFEGVEDSEKFVVGHCAHAFCNSCIGRYVAAKVGENVAVIGCPDPGCEEGVVEMGLCRGIVPSELFDRWNVALCEDLLGDDKFYCPFKDCSALLVHDDGAARIRETECPHCHRLFCARCRVPWHNGIKCKDFRKLGEDEKGEHDLTLKKLANKKKWQRCPSCKMYVARRSGCLLIKCRCNTYFCYNCGSKMDRKIHYCKNCNR